MDFLAVGDLVVDDFIRLKDARVHCNINDEECEICMRWGDKIPYDFHVLVPAVGNSANAAVALARLGLTSGLRAYVGADQYGAQCVASLAANGVSTDFVEKQAGKTTNYHYVLWFEGQRTILVKHEHYDYALPVLSEAEGPKWLYLSSLGDNSLDYHAQWLKQLAEWPAAKLAFQPGTYQMQFGKDSLKDVYARTDIVFCNKEEAERILGLPAGQDMRALLEQMRALGPKAAVITDDVRGATAMDASGAWFIPRYPDPSPPYEITGAGDAFASTAVAALILGKNLPDALMWGAVNASSVLQKVGAQEGLLTRAQLEENLSKSPAPFSVRPL